MWGFCYNRGMEFTKKDLIVSVLFVFIIFAIFYFKSSPQKSPETEMPTIPEYTQKDNLESEAVEKYLRDNIKTIATNSPVLGGSWYVVSTTVDPNTGGGSIVYEDGHIQSNAKFNYTFAMGSVTITNFEIIK